MPNSGLDDLNIAQQACTRVGLAPIAEFDGPKAEQVVLNASYETLVRSAIGGYRYNWASVEVSMVMDASPPLQRFDAAFLLPADLVEVNEFRVNDTPTTYSRYNQYIFVDSDPNQTNILIYTFRPITSQWPAVFTNGIIWKLSALLLSGVKEDYAGANELDQVADRELTKAQFADSSAVTSTGFDLQNQARVRRGGSPLRQRR